MKAGHGFPSNVGFPEKKEPRNGGNGQGGEDGF